MRRVAAFENDQAEADGNRDNRYRSEAGQQEEGGIVKREYAAEQHVQQINIAAAHRDDQHAGGKRDQIESGQAGIFLDHRIARYATRQQGHGNAGNEAAQRHRRKRKSGDQVADGSARQNGVGNGVAGQTHAAQHQEHPNRRRAE